MVRVGKNDISRLVHVGRCSTSEGSKARYEQRHVLFLKGPALQRSQIMSSVTDF